MEQLELAIVCLGLAGAFIGLISALVMLLDTILKIRQ